jgi:hypothetical protein
MQPDLPFPEGIRFCERTYILNREQFDAVHEAVNLVHYLSDCNNPLSEPVRHDFIYVVGLINRAFPKEHPLRLN